MLCLYLSTYTIYKCAFAPQRRAIFRHLNFKKRPVAEVFVAFWLGKVFGPTLTCIFSTSEFEKVIQDHQFLFWILTWKRSSCRSGVQFFFSPLNSYLRSRRFSEPTFRPIRPIRPTDFRNARVYLLSTDSTFFWLYFLLTLPLCSAFHVSILSEVWLLISFI